MEVNNYKDIYELSYNFLLKNLPDWLDEGRLQDYFIADWYKNLWDIYNRILISAQNRQSMPNTIKMCERQNEIKTLLHNYDFDWIISKTPEYFLNTFKEHYQITRTDKWSYWYKWTETIVDWAWFMKLFKSTNEFEKFVKSFDTTIEKRWELSEFIAKKIELWNWNRWIKWLWEALTCDFLKEIWFINYLKPDVHIIEICYQAWLTPTKDEKYVFKFLSKVAEENNITPYKLDKIIWLICSWNFYKEKTSKKNWHKAEFIKYLCENLWTEPKLDLNKTPTKKDKIKTKKWVKESSWNQDLLEFWNLLNQYIKKEELDININQPHNKSWYKVFKLKPTSEIYIERLSSSEIIRVSLWIKKDLDTFDKLYTMKNNIERDFWHNLERNRMHWKWNSSIIYYEITWIVFNDKNDYSKQIELAISTSIKLKSSIWKYI